MEKMRLATNTFRARLFPALFEAVIWKDTPTTKKNCRINSIEYGSTGQEIRDPNKVILLTENEFPFMSNPMLEAYAYISGFDLIWIQDYQRKLIKEFVNAVYPDTKC
jgi:hypothetical protein